MTAKRKGKRSIINRLATMRWEFAKSLTPDPKILSIEEQRIRSSILCLDGICEYCRKNKASGSVGDHFYPVIIEKSPSVYCDDEWNIIPACVTCNSSKSGKSWNIWLKGNAKHNPIRSMTPEQSNDVIEKFKAYDIVMQTYCQKKNIDIDFFKKLESLAETYLLNLQTMVDEYKLCNSI